MFKIRRRRQLIMSQNYSNFLECMTALKWKTIFLHLLNIFLGLWITTKASLLSLLVLLLDERRIGDYVLYVMEFVMLFLFQR